MTIKLGFSSLTKKIYAGTAKDVGNRVAVFTGEKHDVTDDFLYVLTQFTAAHGGAFSMQDGAKKYEVRVTEKQE